MLIDWFTVGAQLLNFLVLIWLMKRFLYQPVLDAIDSREKQVAAVLAEADAKKVEARHERDELKDKNAAFDQQRAALWASAGDEAAAERQRLLDAAARAAADADAKRQDARQAGAAALNQAIGLRAQQEVFAIVRKTLAELADAALEDRACAVFIGRLRALDGTARQRLAAAIAAGAGAAHLRSAFDLPAARRAELQQAVNETFSADVPLRFETAPELVAGIELAVNGQKLGWSIAEHVAALVGSVDELLVPKPAARPVVVADAAPVVEPKAAAETVAA